MPIWIANSTIRIRPNQKDGIPDAAVLISISVIDADEAKSCRNSCGPCSTHRGPVSAEVPRFHLALRRDTATGISHGDGEPPNGAASVLRFQDWMSVFQAADVDRSPAVNSLTDSTMECRSIRKWR